MVRTVLVQEENSKIIAELETLPLDVSAVANRTRGRVSVPISGYRGKFVRLRETVEGEAAHALGIVPGLVEVHFVGKGSLAKHERARSKPSGSVVPADCALSACYPNPFNPEATVRYAVPRRMPVRIEVYDLLGRKIATLVDRVVAPGYHAVRWNGRDSAGRRVSAGIYLCRMQAGKFTAVRKMTLLP